MAGMIFTLNLNGIPYTELHEGSGEEGRLDGARVLACSWANRYALAQNLYGGWFTGSDGVPIFRPSQKHPSNDNMWVNDFSFSKLGKPQGENTWEYAKVSVSYKTSPFNPSEQDTMEETLDGNEDIVTAEGDAFEVEDDGGRVERDVSLLLVTQDYTRTLHRVYAPAFAAYANLQGKLNTDTLSLFNGAMSVDPYHALFHAPSVRYKVTNFGTREYTVGVKLTISDRDMREEFDPEDGGWALIKTKAGGNYKFESGAFMPVLRVNNTGNIGFAHEF